MFLKLGYCLYLFLLDHIAATSTGIDIASIAQVQIDDEVAGMFTYGRALEESRSKQHGSFQRLHEMGSLRPADDFDWLVSTFQCLVLPKMLDPSTGKDASWLFL